MSVAQTKAARRRIKLRYPAPRQKRGTVIDVSGMKKGQKMSKRR
jgi:hypothetical protein